jgi:DeoR family fructose operon transcriptional repressor
MSMNFQKRKQSILQHLEQTGDADIKALAASLKVSEITIRRDLNLLAEDGLLRRTHGGAIKITPLSPPHPFQKKAALNIKAKESIARRAAAEIHDGDILFLDCGSTVFQLCPFIKNKKVRVITNSLPVIHELQDSAVAINIVGGEFDRERLAVHGKMAEYHVGMYRAGKAFLGVDGISPNGLFANSEIEASMTLAIAANSAAVYLLCDNSKIGRETYWHFAGLQLPRIVFTDASVASCEFLKERGITVIHV